MTYDKISRDEDNSSRITHYQLSDGRIWSIADARFVSPAPEDAVFGPCPDEHGKSSLEGLIGCLHFYGYELGEMATNEDLASEAREKRNALIAETDFMLMPDYPLSEAKRQALMAYRQTLRDVPAQAGFPRQIDWPVKP